MNQEKMIELIKKNNIYLDFVKKDSIRFIDNIYDLNKVYSGEDLSIIFSPIIERANTFKHINDVLDSYLDTLVSVEKAYLIQKEVMNQELKCFARNLNNN